jgi:hypothetical protein
MIGGAGAGCDEGGTAGTQCLEKAVIGCRVDRGELRQILEVGAPGRSI